MAALESNPFTELDQLQIQYNELQEQRRTMEGAVQSAGQKINQLDEQIAQAIETNRQWSLAMLKEETDCLITEKQLELRSDSQAASKADVAKLSKELDFLKSSETKIKDEYIKLSYEVYNELNVFTGTFHSGWQNRISAKDRQLATVKTSNKPDVMQFSTQDALFDDELDAICAKVTLSPENDQKYIVVD